MPSPEKPGLQKQLKDPSVLLHMAFSLQLSIFIAHSSISKQKWWTAHKYFWYVIALLQYFIIVNNFIIIVFDI